MVQIERKSGVKGQIVSVEQWVNGDEVVKVLGLPSKRSLERLRAKYPDFVKKVHSVFMYNIGGIIGS